MSSNKKELEVAALENGTVIDHIPADALFKVVELLGLNRLPNSITIGNNLASKKIGKKGIIKIADKYFAEEELNRIAVVAPNVKLNIIHDYVVTEKRSVVLPDEITGIVRCSNPKCVSNNEPMTTHFSVVEKSPIRLKCRYCERVMEKGDIELL
jgi:aspartate carbamoyltransferase regulatory subunit